MCCNHTTYIFYIKFVSLNTYIATNETSVKFKIIQIMWCLIFCSDSIPYPLFKCSLLLYINIHISLYHQAFLLPRPISLSSLPTWFNYFFFFFFIVNIFSILIVSHPLLSSASHIFILDPFSSFAWSLQFYIFFLCILPHLVSIQLSLLVSIS